MSKIRYSAMFTGGFVIGAFVAWQYTKRKYEDILRLEIDSVKDVGSRKHFDAKEEKDDDPQALLDAYHQTVKPYDSDGSDRPYVISPEEFGSQSGYTDVSLTYYADGVLADENDEVVDDADDIVGLESLMHFGEYEDDSVFVRNDTRKCDYEILLDQRYYSDVIKTKLHYTEV